MACGAVRLGGVDARLFRISFSGEHAYEIAVPARYGAALFDLLVARAAAMGGGADGMEALNVLRLEKGHQLALVGTTGSGKSTILRLISKVYQDYEGSILLNGIELSSLSIEDAMPLFSLMQQDVYLFDESIAFNIGLGKPSVDREQIHEAARYVYADGFIKTLPGGYDMELDGNGANLSAGQTQLISFARAVAQGGQVIMLDEATSSVDSVTENLIQRAISRLFKERTVIAIAHRLSTIRHSDTILVLEQGRVVEQGNHEQLLAKNAVYAGLLQQADDPGGAGEEVVLS